MIIFGNLLTSVCGCKIFINLFAPQKCWTCGEKTKEQTKKTAGTHTSNYQTLQHVFLLLFPQYHGSNSSLSWGNAYPTQRDKVHLKAASRLNYQKYDAHRPHGFPLCMLRQYEKKSQNTYIYHINSYNYYILASTQWSSAVLANNVKGFCIPSLLGVVSRSSTHRSNLCPTAPCHACQL